MKIILRRFLRGPNLYSDIPCLLTMVDLGPLDHASTISLSGFTDRLLVLMPTLEEHRCSRGMRSGLIERTRRHRPGACAGTCDDRTAMSGRQRSRFRLRARSAQ